MSFSINSPLRRLLALTAAFALAATVVVAQTVPQSGGEVRVAHALEAAKKRGAPELYAFLKPFPKGADLHMHLSGAIYAETFLDEAAQQGICVDLNALAFAELAKNSKCPDGQMAAADLVHKGDDPTQHVYDKFVAAFSMKNFVPFASWSGHDQFFATFDHFGGLDKKWQGAWIDEVATRAATQNEQYLEIMQTPSFSHVFSAIAKAPWPSDFNDANHLAVLAKYRDQLLANGLADDVAIDTEEFAHAQASRNELEHCGVTPDSVQLKAPNACSVHVHFLYQVLRGFPPAQVFGQTLLGFELASHDPDVVGINFVRAEDWRGPMAEYHTEMLMLDYLHSVYPAVHISLHAGELAPGMVPPDGLTFHIREAIDLGHAERIGHGVDLLSEDRPQDLLKQMASKHIDVEINLVSNEGILGITGTRHPLAAYRAAHVPFSLSTDDEGVSRTDLTHNYVQAVLDQNLTYADLKLSARDSLEHSFLHGESLYTNPDDYTHRKSACAAPIKAAFTATCKAFLLANEKAAQQYELELRFNAFEAAQP